MFNTGERELGSAFKRLIFKYSETELFNGTSFCGHISRAKSEARDFHAT